MVRRCVWSRYVVNEEALSPLGAAVPNIKKISRSILPPSRPLPNVTSEVTRMAVTAVPGTVTQHVLNGFVNVDTRKMSWRDQLLSVIQTS